MTIFNIPRDRKFPLLYKTTIIATKATSMPAQNPRVTENMSTITFSIKPVVSKRENPRDLGFRNRKAKNAKRMCGIASAGSTKKFGRVNESPTSPTGSAGKKGVRNPAAPMIPMTPRMIEPTRRTTDNSFNFSSDHVRFATAKYKTNRKGPLDERYTASYPCAIPWKKLAIDMTTQKKHNMSVTDRPNNFPDPFHAWTNVPDSNTTVRKSMGENRVAIPNCPDVSAEFNIK